MYSLVVYSPPSASSKGSALGELTSVHGLSFSLELEGGDSIGFSLDGRSSDMALLSAYQVSDVMLMYDETPIQRFRLKGNNGSVSPDKHDAQFSGMSYKVLLDTQAILPTDVPGITDPYQQDLDVQLGFIDMDPELIGWKLIDRVQSRDSYVLLGITRGIGQSTGVSRGTEEAPVRFSYGSKVGSAISGIASQSSTTSLSPDSGSFEWDITYDQVYRVWPGGRGSEVPLTLAYPDNVQSYTYNNEANEYANVVAIQGEFSDIIGIAYADDLSSLAMGRMDYFETVGGIVSNYQAQQRANWTLAKHGIQVPSLTLVLSPGTWNSPVDLGLGDVPHLDLQDGYSSIVRGDLRVVKIDVSVSDDSNVVSPTITLGRVIPNIYQSINQINDRIDSVTKRDSSVRIPQIMFTKSDLTYNDDWVFTGNATISGQTLTLAPTFYGDTLNTATYKRILDLTSGSYQFAVTTIPSSADANFTVNFSDVYDPTNSYFEVFLYLIGPGEEVHFKKNSGTSMVSSSVTYVAPTVYWKFYVYGSKFYFDTSADNVTWTNRFSRVTSDMPPLNKMRVKFSALGNTAGGTVTVQSINI